MWRPRVHFFPRSMPPFGGLYACMRGRADRAALGRGAGQEAVPLRVPSRSTWASVQQPWCTWASAATGVSNLGQQLGVSRLSLAVLATHQLGTGRPCPVSCHVHKAVAGCRTHHGCQTHHTPQPPLATQNSFCWELTAHCRHWGTTQHPGRAQHHRSRTGHGPSIRAPHWAVCHLFAHTATGKLPQTSCH